MAARSNEDIRWSVSPDSPEESKDWIHLTPACKKNIMQILKK
jgi:hypothetical protein